MLVLNYNHAFGLEWEATVLNNQFDLFQSLFFSNIKSFHSFNFNYGWAYTYQSSFFGNPGGKGFEDLF